MAILLTMMVVLLQYIVVAKYHCQTHIRIWTVIIRKYIDVVIFLGPLVIISMLSIVRICIFGVCVGILVNKSHQCC